MRKSQMRRGACVPMEGVDPHSGSFLTYGVIVGWVDADQKPCSRKMSVAAVVESSGRKCGEWNAWAKEHAFELMTLDDFEAIKDGLGVL